MIFNIISIVALVISIWSAYGVYQNTKILKHITNALGDMLMLVMKRKRNLEMKEYTVV